MENRGKDTLKNDFLKIHKTISHYDDWKSIVSTQNNGKIMAPYIPFEGKKYNEYKIMLYGTAQNISWNYDYRNELINNSDKCMERLYYDKKFKKKYPLENISYNQIGIGPYACGILPALIGIFIFAKFGKKISQINVIHDYITMTNYYKYSLHTKTKDINPDKIDNTELKSKFKKEYLRINDELVKKETCYFAPKYIISFNGRKNIVLSKNKNIELYVINDPAWIKRGGSKMFSTGGKWYKIAKKYNKDPINELIDLYLKKIKNNEYEKLKDKIKIYLLFYYDQWKIK